MENVINLNQAKADQEFVDVMLNLAERFKNSSELDDRLMAIIKQFNRACINTTWHKNWQRKYANKGLANEARIKD